MDKITIDATSHTPSVDFDQNGILKIEGRSFPENASEFYDPLIEFADTLDIPNVCLNVNLEYINTASSKKFLTLLKTLDDNEKISSVHLNWFYEEGDDDSVETAEIYEESLKRIRFTYNEVADLNCRNQYLN
jgi:hypothetical protein